MPTPNISPEVERRAFQIFLEEYEMKVEPRPSANEMSGIQRLAIVMLGLGVIFLLLLSATRSYDGFYVVFAAFTHPAARTAAALFSAIGMEITIFSIPFFWRASGGKLMDESSVVRGVMVGLVLILLTTSMSVASVSIGSIPGIVTREDLEAAASVVVTIGMPVANVVSGYVFGEILIRFRTSSTEAERAWLRKARTAWERMKPVKKQRFYTAAMTAQAEEKHETQPEKPKRASQRTSHNASARARELFEAGYTRQEVAGILKREGVPSPSARAIASRIAKEFENASSNGSPPAAA